MDKQKSVLNEKREKKPLCLRERLRAGPGVRSLRRKGAMAVVEPGTMQRVALLSLEKGNWELRVNARF